MEAVGNDICIKQQIHLKLQISVDLFADFI